MRRFVYRTRYLRMRDLVLRLQCIARTKMAQTQLKTLQEENAAITIQKHWRRYTARKEYTAKKSFVYKLQTGKKNCEQKPTLFEEQRSNMLL